MRQRCAKLAGQVAGRATSALCQANAGAAGAPRHLNTATAAVFRARPRDEVFSSEEAAAAAYDRHAHGSATMALFHSQAQQSAAAAGAQSSSQADAIPFPREGPGVSYALNWALAATGVTPSGTVSRNLKAAKLAELSKGSAVKSTSGSKVLIQGGSGDAALAPALFRRMLREVTTHLSGLPTLFVQDGAVGSSSSSDARTRCVCASAGAASALSSVLCPTPTRELSASSFPLTLYAVPGYKNADIGGAGFLAADLAAGLIIAAGAAVGDAAALKTVLAAAAAGPISSRGALLLPGRLVTGKGSQGFLLLSPTSAGDSLLASSAAWPELGAIWGPAGVARPFPVAAKAPPPNLYLPPSALVLLTSDSTGGIPAASQLTPEQAAFYFLSGYDGSSFNPAFARSASSADPLKTSQALASLVGSTSTPAYLVNAHGQTDVSKFVSSVAAGKAPASKPASEDAATEVKTKLADAVKARFPNLPEDIAP